MSTIQSVMQETRVFEPSSAWIAQANVKKADFDAMNAKAARDFEGFWGDARRSSGASRSPGC
jgi:acetyl-CoA synthetase